MYRIISYFASLEVMGFWGFIIASRYQSGIPTRLLPLLLASAAVVFVAYLNAKAFSYKKLAYISVVASAIFVLSYFALGFTLYSGIVKDLDFLSAKMLNGTVVMLSIGTVGHFLLLSLAKQVRQNSR